MSDADQMIADIRGGMSVSAAAARHGIAYRKALDIAKNAGLTFKKGHHTGRPLKMAQLVISGMTRADVARRFNVTAVAVTRACRRHGLAPIIKIGRRTKTSGASHGTA
jgi:transposase-like protein